MTIWDKAARSRKWGPGAARPGSMKNGDSEPGLDPKSGPKELKNCSFAATESLRYEAACVSLEAYLEKACLHHEAWKYCKTRGFYNVFPCCTLVEKRSPQAQQKLKKYQNWNQKPRNRQLHDGPERWPQNDTKFVLELVCHGISLSWNRFEMEYDCHGISMTWNKIYCE